MSDSSQDHQDRSQLREIILSVSEEMLEAQLHAIRELQGKPRHLLELPRSTQKRKKGMSHIDMAFDILSMTAGPMHVSRLIAAIKESFGIAIDSESLVSALSKRVARKDRFTRSAPNTFALLENHQGNEPEQG
jgi:hypothetical protein